MADEDEILAVMLADSGETIADLAVLRSQTEVSGSVASTPTAWRLLADGDRRALNCLRSGRASAREAACLQHPDRGSVLAARVAGRMLPGLVLELDATLAPLREGGGGTHIQGQFRVPPAGVLPGRHQRGVRGCKRPDGQVALTGSSWNFPGRGGPDQQDSSGLRRLRSPAHAATPLERIHKPTGFRARSGGGDPAL